MFWVTHFYLKLSCFLRILCYVWIESDLSCMLLYMNLEFFNLTNLGIGKPNSLLLVYPHRIGQSPKKNFFLKLVAIVLDNAVRDNNFESLFSPTPLPSIPRRISSNEEFSFQAWKTCWQNYLTLLKKRNSSKKKTKKRNSSKFFFVFCSCPIIKSTWTFRTLRNEKNFLRHALGKWGRNVFHYRYYYTEQWRD